MNKEIFKYAVIQTLPVMFGYLFMGMAFGILLEEAGFNFLWALLISASIYSGSMQFVMIGFLAGGIGFISMMMMTLSVQSRHMFYGLSFIEKFKAMGKKGWYMVFSLTDETYSLLCGMAIPQDLDEEKVFLTVAILNQTYWVVGCTLGGLIGGWIWFDTTGIDFAMTALFVVIFVEQWLANPSHAPALIGLFSGLACLLIFGPQGFLLPALLITVTLLLLLDQKSQGPLGEIGEDHE